MYSMGRFAVIGRRNDVLQYRTLGADVIMIDNKDEIRSVFPELLKKDYAVILVTDDLMSEIRDYFFDSISSPVPGVISIPGKTEYTAFIKGELNTRVKKAIGIDLGMLWER